MPKVEQGISTSQELYFEGPLEHGDLYRIEQEIKTKRRGLIVTWRGANNKGTLVEQSMRYSDSAIEPRTIVLSFREVQMIEEYQNINFHPEVSTSLGLEAIDIADFFIIAHRALADCIPPANIKAAFQEAFSSFSKGERGRDKRVQLARELINRKYLS